MSLSIAQCSFTRAFLSVFCMLFWSQKSRNAVLTSTADDDPWWNALNTVCKKMSHVTWFWVSASYNNWSNWLNWFTKLFGWKKPTVRCHGQSEQRCCFSTNQNPSQNSRFSRLAAVAHFASKFWRVTSDTKTAEVLRKRERVGYVCPFWGEWGVSFFALSVHAHALQSFVNMNTAVNNFHPPVDVVEFPLIEHDIYLLIL